ncbi:hypothetical protein ABZ690_17770 [Streptomyces sp. NPDC006967]|uniref:hypothetical protein n=1 Tax=Streptomyces sp. NPDC006967 TaxID=3156906 RepID=UPI0033F66657
MMSELASSALRVINAAWQHGPSYDLAAQAAFALESAHLLQSSETAAELERLRERATATPAALPPEQRAAIAAHLATVKPASTQLVAGLAKAVHDVREHEHPQWEDLYCLNLLSYMGERMGPVLRRLLDAEARVAALETDLTVKRQYAEAAATVAELVQQRGERMKVENALRDEVEELRSRVAELEARIAAEECCCPEPAPLCEGCRCRCHAQEAAPLADGITQRIAPVQALRESPAAHLAGLLSGSQPDVTAAEVLDDRTIRLTVRPHDYTAWRDWLTRLRVDVATITARGAVTTGTGEHQGVTVHLLGEGVTGLMLAARDGEDR